MCTAISLNLNEKAYFIRTLDLDYSFGKNVILTPREYPLPMRRLGVSISKYAFFGIGNIIDSFPLYADGVNEAGLMIGGLHFPTMNGYMEPNGYKDDCLAPFEIIPYILGKFKKSREACNFLSGIQIADIQFNSEIKNTPLHFHIADRDECFVLEIIDKRVRIDENPFFTLTNAPPFSFHRYNMARYVNLSPEGARGANESLIYSNGLMATGLPGDFSSPSRFVRAAWLRSVARCNCGLELEASMRLGEAISIPCGAVITKDERLHFTRYFSVYDINNLRVLIKRYEKTVPSVIEIKKESLASGSLISYDI